MNWNLFSTKCACEEFFGTHPVNLTQISNESVDKLMGALKKGSICQSTGNKIVTILLDRIVSRSLDEEETLADSKPWVPLTPEEEEEIKNMVPKRMRGRLNKD